MVTWSQLVKEPLHYCRDISRENKILIVLGTSAATLGLFFWLTRRGDKKLPPGPWGLPFLGAIHQFGEHMHLDCARLRKIYGDIFSFKLGKGLWVVVNGYPALRETFINRGEEFAGRPMSAFEDIVHMDEEIFQKDYNDEWKKSKKFAMVALKNFHFGSPKLEKKVNCEIENLLTVCREKQNGFYIRPLLESASARVLSSVILEGARPFTEEEFEELKEQAKAFFDSQTVTLNLSSAFLPVWLLKLLHRKQIDETNALLAKGKDFIKSKIKEHQEMVDPTHPRDVLDMYISQRLDKDMTMDQVAGTILGFFSDAIKTLTQALDTFLLFVIKHKQVQEKLHEELDRVVGRSGQVSLSHKPDLPYLQATIYETWRLAPLAPLSAPHKPISDTTLLGYHIPKNAFIFPNLHSVHSDPVIFPNPELFNPGHFMDEEGQIVNAEYCIPFSVGRRMCLGESYAKLFTFLFLANLLHEFQFCFPNDQPEPEEKYDISAGLLYLQEPFQICVRPREK